ncbi:DMT family transporter [Arenibaculum sp.]|uniref:DMT family transporter n=1 Tax=Arenibaculum sp. TaxID=2865862 RepID=UPI002E1209B4|nr:DMT family transporter [Arenibaculum sp.]
MLLAGITLFWGLNWPAMKIAMLDIEPWAFRGLCLAVGALGMVATARAGGRSLHVPRSDILPLVAVSLLNVTGWHLASALGLAEMQAGRASIVAFTMPLWASLLGVLLLGERMTAARVAGLALGLAGMGALLASDVASVIAAPRGVLLMLLGALCWAGGTVMLKAVRWNLDTMQLAAWQLAIGSVPVVLGAFAVGSPSTILAVGWTTGLAALYTCLIPMIWCHYAWYSVVSLFPANVAAIGTLAIPVVGVFSSALLLGEAVGPNELAALALVVAGLFLVMIFPGLPASRR